MRAGIVPMTWSIKQQEVAKLLAVGFSQTAASTRTGTPLKTVQNWWAKDDYRAEVQRLHDSAWQRVGPMMENLLLHAVEVERQVLNGELDAADGRYKAAQRRIDQFIEHMAVAPQVVSHPSYGALRTDNEPGRGPIVPQLPARNPDPV